MYFAGTQHLAKAFHEDTMTSTSFSGKNSETSIMLAIFIWKERDRDAVREGE